MQTSPLQFLTQTTVLAEKKHYLADAVVVLSNLPGLSSSSGLNIQGSFLRINMGKLIFFSSVHLSNVNLLKQFSLLTRTWVSQQIAEALSVLNNAVKTGKSGWTVVSGKIWLELELLLTSLEIQTSYSSD